MKKKILISGTSSGLGKYLAKKFNATKLNRKKISKKIKNTNWDLIIHCAFNSKTYDLDNFQQYFRDNILLSYSISKLKGKKIFLSTTQIYENNNINKRKEVDVIDEKELSLYPLSKLICEKFFSSNDLILRLGSIVGKSMRQNTIVKLISVKKPKINLDSKSKFSFISYEEIYKFILVLVKLKKKGIYNFLRTDFCNLKKIQDSFFKNKKVSYGKYNFNATYASNNKSSKIFNTRKLSSIDILKKIFSKN